jgi:hypothetical protein
MKLKNLAAFLSLLIVMSILTPCEGWSQPLAPSEGGPTRPGTHSPIITHTFAVEKGYYGYIWKIYIEAEDPDGDMIKIASVVDQVGYGHYPTNWNYLKRDYGKNLKGYLQWNTFSSKTGYLDEWTQITVTVSVFDKAGNESNVVFFPFTFELTKNPYAYKPPAPFDRGDLPRLGYISVDLFNPRTMGAGFGSWD